MTNDILTVMRSLQAQLSKTQRDDYWALKEHVDAFFDGSLKTGEFIDPITEKKGTLRTFVECAKGYCDKDETGLIRKIELCALAALHYRMAKNFLEAAKC